ncbi:MAG: hypothetical protein D6703_06645, partial [Zetaproteobacteria bacterium]
PAAIFAAVTDPFLIFFVVTALFLILLVVTALLFSWAVPTEFRGNGLIFATAVALSGTVVAALDIPLVMATAATVVIANVTMKLLFFICFSSMRLMNAFTLSVNTSYLI